MPFPTPRFTESMTFTPDELRALDCWDEACEILGLDVNDWRRVVHPDTPITFMPEQREALRIAVRERTAF